MTEVVWTAEALANLRNLRAYIERFNPSAAERVATQLIEAGDSLATLPNRGRPVPGTSMRELASVVPYVIRYRVADEKVAILRVRHGARRPTKP